uniref:Endonuclease/exonuclease/phosphatase domain-containing protein n=1 Tax=Romanomermis culicivorax TaxID=13658 RepID=A0A915KWC4_ROMCU
MLKFSLLSVVFLAQFSQGVQGGGRRPVKARLRFMTFNVWYSGINVFNGLEKIARHVALIKPDIVALQEIEGGRLDALLTMLPGSWAKCNDTMGVPNAPYIITRFPIQKHYRPMQSVRSVACQILVERTEPSLYVNVWNVHLPRNTYGPHEACFNHYARSYWDLREVEEDFNSEFSPKRVNAIRALVRDDQFWHNMGDADEQPLILAGTMNTPSHLDWTEKTKHLHCGQSFPWPVTQLLQDHGLTDSYREMYTNPAEYPGNTWSPVVDYNQARNASEPQDRIDYIFYKSRKMSPVAARIYQGNRHLDTSPNHVSNDWPSDHASVVTDFDIYG